MQDVTPLKQAGEDLSSNDELLSAIKEMMDAYDELDSHTENIDFSDKASLGKGMILAMEHDAKVARVRKLIGGE